MSIIYTIASWTNEVFGYRVMSALPLLFFVILAFRQIRQFRLNLVIVAMLFAAFPMVTPLATDIAGFRYFTALNYDLQADSALKTAAILLISLFCISFYAGGSFTNRYTTGPGTIRVVFDEKLIVILFVVIFFLLFRYLESDFVIETAYGAIKQNTSPFSSTANQVFNAFAAVFLSYIGSDRRKRTIIIIYAAVFVLSMLMARRTLAIGIMIVTIYTLGRHKFSAKEITLLLLTIALLYFIGVARATGIVEFFTSGPIKSNAGYFTLPGGASNVFVGTMGVIDLWNRPDLAREAFMPILQWVWGIYESDVYRDFGYQYNGGMHMANILYWNFGLIGVVAGGFGLGRITQRCDILLRRLPSTGGTLGGMLAVGFALTLPNTLWYSPIGAIKLSVVIVIAYWLIRAANGPFLLRARRLR